jgi:hypothetical protein
MPNSAFKRRDLPEILPIGRGGTGTDDGSITGSDHLVFTPAANRLIKLNGDSEFLGNLLPDLTDTRSIGSSTKWFKDQFVTQINATIFAEQTISLVGGWMVIGKNQVKLPSVASAQTQIDFGTLMYPGDFIVIKAHDASNTIKTEYMQIGTLVSGTTYNVTRDIAAMHVTDPVWTDGTPGLVLGTTGDGRIEFNAYDTPRISVMTQGAAYNLQTEVIRLGDLNGIGGIATQKFGIYIGTANNHMQYNATDDSLIVTGTIKASAGYIGGVSSGWAIGSNILSGGSGATYIALDQANSKIRIGAKTSLSDANTGVHLGSDGLALGASSVFVVTAAGALTATSATITGVITATSGTFTGTVNANAGNFTGNVTIGTHTDKITIAATAANTTTAIYAGTGTYGNTNTGFFMDASGRFSLKDKLTWDGTTLSISGGGTFTGALSGGTISIGSANAIFKADSNGIYLGNATFASAPFSVTPAGVLKATSGTIANWTLSTTSIQTGAFDTVSTMYFGTSGLSLSNTFKVTAAGVLTATGATISGVLTATSGTFTGTINANAGNFTSTVTIGNGATTGTLNVGTHTNKIVIIGTNANTTTAIYGGQTGYATGSGFWMDASGRFSVGTATNYLKFAATGIEIATSQFSLTSAGVATFSGALSAASGSFAGSLSAVTGTLGALTVNGILTLGTGTIASTNFNVTSAGVVTATSATITGVINANTGYLGGATNYWNITAGLLTSVGTASIVMATASSTIKVGAVTTVDLGAGIFMDGNGNFRAGTATSGTDFIKATTTALTIKASTFDLSTATLKITSAPSISLGATPPTSATAGTGIWINAAGIYGLSSNTQNFILSATDGSVTAISGTIGGWTLNSNYLRATNGGTYGTNLVNIMLNKVTHGSDSATATPGGLMGFHITGYENTSGATGFRVGMGKIGSGHFYTTTEIADYYGIEGLYSTNPGSWSTSVMFRLAFRVTDGAIDAQIAGWKFDAGKLYNVGASGTFTGLQSSATGTTKAFFTGATDATGTSAKAYINVDGSGALSNGGIAWDNAGNITAVNKITAGSGTIANWNITASSIQTGAFDTVSTMYFGSSGISLSNTFKVTAAGALTATSATITGIITANTGYIGGTTNGWQILAGEIRAIGTGKFTTSSTTTRVEVDSTGLKAYNAGTQRVQILSDGSGWLGSSSDFSWTNAGVLSVNKITATSGSIAGWLIDTTKIYNTNISISNATLAAASGDIILSGGDAKIHVGTGVHLDGLSAGTVLLGAATSISAGNGVFIGGDGTFRAGNASASRLLWDGTNVEIYNSSNAKVVSLGTTNTIAGWTATASQIYSGTTYLSNTSSLWASQASRITLAHTHNFASATYSPALGGSYAGTGSTGSVATYVAPANGYWKLLTDTGEAEWSRVTSPAITVTSGTRYQFTFTLASIGTQNTAVLVEILNSSDVVLYSEVEQVPGDYSYSYNLVYTPAVTSIKIRFTIYTSEEAAEVRLSLLTISSIAPFVELSEKGLFIYTDPNTLTKLGADMIDISSIRNTFYFDVNSINSAFDYVNFGIKSKTSAYNEKYHIDASNYTHPGLTILGNGGDNTYASMRIYSTDSTYGHALLILERSNKNRLSAIIHKNGVSQYNTQWVVGTGLADGGNTSMGWGVSKTINLADVKLFVSRGGSHGTDGFVGLGHNVPTNRLTLYGGTTAAQGIGFSTGSVSAAADTVLYRGAAGQLTLEGTDSDFVLNSPTSTVRSQVTFKDNGTTKALFGVAFATDAIVNTSADGDFCIRTQGGKILLSTDSGTTPHMTLTSTGATLSNTLFFGTAADTNLYRSAANTLKTDDALIVTGALTTAGFPLCRYRGEAATWPSSPLPGDVFYDTNYAAVYIYTTTGSWIQIGSV